MDPRIQDIVQRGDDVVWVFRGAYGKRLKRHAVLVGTTDRKLKTFWMPDERDAVAALAALKQAIPRASVGWDSDAYVLFRFRRDPARLQGRVLDVDDVDTGFRGFLLWRALKPVLLPLAALSVLVFVLTRSFILMRLVGLTAPPGSDAFLQNLLTVTRYVPPDIVFGVTLGILGVTAWVGVLGWVDRSKGRLHNVDT